jgi:aryl-alcohol dehydrogenase-like predicted oxidoreductase
MRTSGHPRDRVHAATKVTGPSAQMPWIRDGPMDAAAIMAAAEDSLLRSVLWEFTMLMLLLRDSEV